MEPGTPQPTLTLDGITFVMAWSDRSNALLSRHGFSVGTMIANLNNALKAQHALCLAVYASMPVALAPDDYLELAKPLKKPETALEALKGLHAILKHAYPGPAEKKSALSGSSAGPDLSSTSESAAAASTTGSSRRSSARR